jgi:phospholipase/carboxylesterase
MKQDNYPFDAVVLEPEQFPTATVIWLHGLGSDGYDFYSVVPQLQLPESSAIRFIFPHAPIRPVTLNRGMKMRAWYDVVKIERDAFEDELNIRASEMVIASMIAYEESRGISSDKIVLAGFSQGGVIALQCGLRYAKPLAGILALSTYLPLAHTLANEIHPSNRSLPIFLAHGTGDDVIPITWARNTRQTLGQYEYGVEWHEYPIAHTVSSSELRDIAVFLKSALGI